MQTSKEAISQENLVVTKTARFSCLGLAMALPPVLVITCFVGIPILIAAGLSLGFTGGPNRVIALIGQEIYTKNHWWGTLDGYKSVFKDPRFFGDLKLTLSVTFVSTVVVIVMALGMAIYRRIRGGKLATVLVSLSLVPLFVPVVISAFAIKTFYDGTGFMKTLFSQFGIDFPTLTMTSSAIAIGTIWTSLPFAILMISSGLQAIPDALIESAQDAGASFFRIIHTIMIPLAFVPIIIATTFTAIGIMGSFTIPYFLGANQPAMLGVEIPNFFSSYNRPQQSVVMAFVIFGAASIVAIFYVWANLRSAKQSGRI
jgi:ABC-type spermidine/putrescine transport system permease subunit I